MAIMTCACANLHLFFASGIKSKHLFTWGKDLNTTSIFTLTFFITLHFFRVEYFKNLLETLSCGFFYSETEFLRVLNPTGQFVKP